MHLGPFSRIPSQRNGFKKIVSTVPWVIGEKRYDTFLQSCFSRGADLGDGRPLLSDDVFVWPCVRPPKRGMSLSPFLYSCCHSITYPREKSTLRQTLIADKGTLSENKENNLRFSHITSPPKWERNPKRARQHVGNARQSVMVLFSRSGRRRGGGVGILC